jgi:hypothetical protein
MNCQLEWVGIYQWWCQMDPSGQAAWVQGTVSVFALGVAILIPYKQNKHEKDEKAATDRKIVMSAAANLNIALDYQLVVFDFAPAGDGVIGHDCTFAQAAGIMKLQPQTRDALQSAIEKSPYFSEDLCSRVVWLGIDAAAYERIVEEVASMQLNGNADKFFQEMKNTKDTFAGRVRDVSELLRKYLSDAGSRPT